MKKIRVSKSAVLMYESCPKAYHFSYIKKIRVKPNIYMQIGLDVHDILDRFFIEAKKLKDGYKDINIPTLVEKVAGNKFKTYDLYLENFIVMEIRRTEKFGFKYWLPIKTEQKIVVDNMVGIIDRIDFDPINGYTIWDYKTGTVGGIGKFKFELCMYKYLVEKQTGLDVTGCGVISLKDGTRVPRNGKKLFIPSQADAEDMFNRINAFIKGVEDEEFGVGIRCNCFWCSYNSICPNSTKRD